jgi:two-component sensor histidine kinase
LRRNGDSIVLSVTDDGAPLAMNGSLDGMGLRLVARLANQLAGALSVDAAQKRFTVAFPRARRLVN